MKFQARLFVADKALDLGRGGISRLSALTGLSRTTITKAVEELESGVKLVSVGEGRVRRVGGGRKKIEGVDPGVRGMVRKMLVGRTGGSDVRKKGLYTKLKTIRINGEVNKTTLS